MLDLGITICLSGWCALGVLAVFSMSGAIHPRVYKFSNILKIKQSILLCWLTESFSLLGCHLICDNDKCKRSCMHTLFYFILLHISVDSVIPIISFQHNMLGKEFLWIYRQTENSCQIKSCANPVEHGVLGKFKTGSSSQIIGTWTNQGYLAKW